MANARARRPPRPDATSAAEAPVSGAPEGGPTEGGPTEGGPREVVLPEHLVGRAPIPPAPPPDQEVLSTRDLAGLMMVPVPTIQRLWRTTDIPGRFVGKELRFVRADIMSWISAGHPAGSADADTPPPVDSDDE